MEEGIFDGLELSNEISAFIAGSCTPLTFLVTREVAPAAILSISTRQADGSFLDISEQADNHVSVFSNAACTQPAKGATRGELATAAGTSSWVDLYFLVQRSDEPRIAISFHSGKEGEAPDTVARAEFTVTVTPALLGDSHASCHKLPLGKEEATHQLLKLDPSVRAVSLILSFGEERFTMVQKAFSSEDCSGESARVTSVLSGSVALQARGESRQEVLSYLSSLSGLPVEAGAETQQIVQGPLLPGSEAPLEHASGALPNPEQVRSRTFFYEFTTDTWLLTPLPPDLAAEWAAQGKCAVQQWQADAPNLLPAEACSDVVKQNQKSVSVIFLEGVAFLWLDRWRVSAPINPTGMELWTQPDDPVRFVLAFD